jgi:hypothetical protein
MDYQFTAQRKDTYLHAIGSGVHSATNMRRFLADVHRLVLAEGWRAVLVEMRFEGPSLDLGSIYSILVENRERAALVDHIAYVDTNVQHLPERTEFVELAASKLGMKGRICRSVAEAEQWLRSCTDHCVSG